MYKYRILLLCVLGLFCKGEIPEVDYRKATQKNKEAWEKYYNSIPELKRIYANKPYEIRVKRIIDPRLEDFSAEKYQALYEQLQKDIEYYFGYRVILKDVGQEDILHFFRKNRYILKKPQFQYFVGQHYLHLNKPEDHIRLKATIEKAVKEKPWNIVKKYMGSASIPNNDISAATEYFYSRFMEKYNQIGNLPVTNGKGILRAGEYEFTQHYTYWSAILNETNEAELFITNSIIAGADDQMPLYVINRGGITSGITENNIHNELQGCIVLTLMPFISNAKYFNIERGNIFENLLIPIISMMGVHEFGHLLLRYDEYYDLPATPQNAPVDLHYQDWYQDIINGSMTTRQLRTLKKY